MAPDRGVMHDVVIRRMRSQISSDPRYVCTRTIQMYILETRELSLRCSLLA